MAKHVTTLRDELIKAGSDLFRRQGYVGTSVDEICAAAGATKGAFFHHFASKEKLAEACLEQWKIGLSKVLEGAAGEAGDPVERALVTMDFLIGVFGNPQFLKSCLAGTLAQEVSETHPTLRAGAHACLVHGEDKFTALLEAALGESRAAVDPRSLARLWIATLQGSFILCKAGAGSEVMQQNLRHVREYVAGIIGKAK